MCYRRCAALEETARLQDRKTRKAVSYYNWDGFFNGVAVLFRGMNCLYRANFSAWTAIGTYIRIDFIDFTFRYCFHRAFIYAGSASSTVVTNFVSHLNLFLVNYTTITQTYLKFFKCKRIFAVSSVYNFYFNGLIACPAQAGEPTCLRIIYISVRVCNTCGFHNLIFLTGKQRWCLINQKSRLNDR